jgi:hypothetical protein
MVCFYSPTVPYLPRSLYQIDLLVVPKWGLYANMIAQLISQVSSHYIIYYHRRVVKDAFTSYQTQKIQQQHPTTEQPQGLASSIRSKISVADVDELQDVNINSCHSDDEPDSIVQTSHDHVQNKEKIALCKNAFRRVHRGEADKIIAYPFVNPMLMVVAASTAICFVVGCILPTFSVTIYGIVGVVVESGQAFVNAKVSYSVFTVMGALFGQAQVTGSIRDYIGLGTL